MNEYDRQAVEFASKTGLEMQAVYLRTGPYFAGDKDTGARRDIYHITLRRKGREYQFEFGQSIVNSRPAVTERPNVLAGIKRASQATPPTLYDVLACVTKYDPGNFFDFCDDYDYDSDSRAVFKVYEAVCAEWRGVALLFGDVLEDLREIQ